MIFIKIIKICHIIHFFKADFPENLTSLSKKAKLYKKITQNTYGGSNTEKINNRSKMKKSIFIDPKNFLIFFFRVYFLKQPQPQVIFIDCIASNCFFIFLILGIIKPSKNKGFK